VGLVLPDWHAFAVTRLALHFPFQQKNQST